ncbi:MAG: glycoside hydrolase [Proteobacteria bacterium]|nr:MAG: glycoside hydrolase [Pseudomonadota bacterium]
MNSPAVLSHPRPAEPLQTGPLTAQTLFVSVVTETFPPEVNGVAMTIGRMIDGLVRLGHRVQLIRPRQRSDEQPTNSNALQEVLVKGMPLPRYAGLRVGFPVGGTLRRLWRANRPDVVHVVTEGPLGSSAVAAARALAIPVSSDFHTNFDSYSQHYGVGLLQPLISSYLRRLHNRTACTFVPTRELRDRLHVQGYTSLEVIARGVDTTLFAPERRSSDLRRRWGAGEDDLVLLHVGRLAPEKNLPVVLIAFEAIHQRLPNARLVLVGDGPQRSALQRKYSRHHFAGMRHGEDLARHYASGDIFLFPSLTETYGNVTIEALASGLAVVAYDYAAAREHIQHGETGLLASYGDSAGFVRAAVAAASDGALRSRLRINARVTAQSIDWAEVVGDLVRALSHLAGRASSANRGDEAR